MSIASDEALEWHGLNGDEVGDRDSAYSAEELDAAYVAGRTAGPTYEEIEAAGIEMYRQELCIIRDGDVTTDEATTALYELIGDDDIAKNTRRQVRAHAALVLQIARRAVTE